MSTKTITFNGKSWETVSKQLQAPFAEKHIMDKGRDTIYIDPSAVKDRIEHVLGPNVSVQNPKVIYIGMVDEPTGNSKPYYHVALSIDVVIVSDCGTITKTITGVGSVSKQYFSMTEKTSFDSSLKSARTRAIRNAASTLGIGNYLYEDEEDEDEDEEPAEEPKNTKAVSETTADILNGLQDKHGITKADMVNIIKDFMRLEGESTTGKSNAELAGYIDESKEVREAFVEYVEDRYTEESKTK